MYFCQTQTYFYFHMDCGLSHKIYVFAHFNLSLALDVWYICSHLSIKSVMYTVHTDVRIQPECCRWAHYIVHSHYTNNFLITDNSKKHFLRIIFIFNVAIFNDADFCVRMMSPIKCGTLSKSKSSLKTNTKLHCVINLTLNVCSNWNPSSDQ